MLRDALGWSAREVADAPRRHRPGREQRAPACARAARRSGRSPRSRGRTRPTDAVAEEARHATLPGRMGGRRHRRHRRAARRRRAPHHAPGGGAHRGRAQIAAFFATVPLAGRLDRIRLVASRANGQPALAAYADEQGDGEFGAYGVMVFALEANGSPGNLWAFRSSPRSSHDSTFRRGSRTEKASRGGRGTKEVHSRPCRTRRETLWVGSALDPATRTPTGERVTIEAADLTTHGSILGMTGSGKTGLAVVLLEEALLRVPRPGIDPKGDLGQPAARVPRPARRRTSSRG